MSTESEILAEVEALKAKFSDTRALYREACVLLFFRFGITPTANKLYQYVRRGSMNVPTEEVSKFWDDLRHKARVDIEHPDLPEPIKAVAAEAIAVLWRQASEAARAELAAARLESEGTVQQSREAVATAEAAVARWVDLAEDLKGQIAQIAASKDALHADLDAERRAVASLQGRVQELQVQREEARGQLQRQQEAFSADLAKARADIESAQERASATERRALLELNQERQARARADKATEAVRAKLGEVEGRERQQALDHASTVTRLQAELTANSSALLRSQETQADGQNELAALRAELADAKQGLARHHAEARTLQALLDRLTPAPPPGTTPRRRKALGT